MPLLKPLGLKIMVEPGRFIVGNAGILVTRVQYVKHTGRKNFVIVDAAMNDLIRPAMYDSYHEIVPVAQRNGKLISSDVVGPVCESADYFCKDRPMPKVGEGDCLAVLSAGAYGFVMASNYNARALAPEILGPRQTRGGRPPPATPGRNLGRGKNPRLARARRGAGNGES